jgi:putative addiction module component (TIGR02574 family)
MATPESILKEALSLKPTERAKLIDILLSSLDTPDEKIEKLWAEEAENRLEAYERGELTAVSLEEVLAKYR